MYLHAHTVVPVNSRPIASGVVEIRRSRIVRAGTRREFPEASSRKIVDLGDVVLLPGLINAHCHLEYTGLAGEFLPPRNFTDWLKLIIAAKAVRPDAEFAAAWQCGAQQLLHTGCTTVADIVALPKLQPPSTPLRTISFLEMTGVRARTSPEAIIAAAQQKISQFHDAGLRTGISPHAPYSTTPELLRQSAETARRLRLRMTMHVAESVDEFEMFTHARGRMYDWLKKQRDCADCGQGTPVEHLARIGFLGANLLAVHVNCLGPGDARLLARKKTSVVHCPRSHSFFSHPTFPYADLASAGVNVCLGTDSLASIEAKRGKMPQLNMFSELRSFARKHRGISAHTILQLGTVNAARALGMAGRIGEISSGAFADLIALPCREKLPDIYEAILHHRGDVAASLINGRWAIAPR